MNVADHIQEARDRTDGHLLTTPLLRDASLSEACDGDVYLKMESEQYTGSFKARGSLNKLMWLREQGEQALPVTASTGNHGLGFARALDLLDMKGRIFLPKNAVTSKVEAIRSYDVDLEFYGDDPYDTEIHTRQMAEENGWVYVSPYNDPQIIAGQGTVGLEILEQIPDPDAVLATVGGGGLISGIGSWIRHHRPETSIIGCQPENSPEMSVSVERGEYVEVESQPTLSDGSAGGFEREAITFDLCRELVDDFILVSEMEIKEGIRYCLQKPKKLVEGSAAVALSAFRKNINRFRGKKVVIVICGGNISYDTVREVICNS